MLMRGGTWWIVILLLGIQVCAEEHASHSCIHDEQMDKFQVSRLLECNSISNVVFHRKVSRAI